MSFEVSFLKRNSLRWSAVCLAFLFWNQTYSSSSSLLMWHSVYYIQGKKIQISQHANYCLPCLVLLYSSPFSRAQYNVGPGSGPIYWCFQAWSSIKFKKTHKMEYSLNLILQFHPGGIAAIGIVRVVLVSAHKSLPEDLCCAGSSRRQSLQRSTGTEGCFPTWLRANQQTVIARIMFSE